jgi:hypothetical protein
VAIKTRHAMLILLPRYFPTRIGLAPAKLLKRFSKTENLGKKWEEKWTALFLKTLLWALSKAFDLSKHFRENIKDFEAKYVFRAERSSIVVSVTFKDGAMEVQKWSQDFRPNVTVVFKDGDALKHYLFSLFSGEQDILELILANDVQLDGNWNYVHKFLFMVNDLDRRLKFWK